MSPREAADRLYKRMMRAVEEGDSAEVQNFLPMAIGAYERARPLDEDGLFHLSSLLRLAGEASAARDISETVLEESPDHLLHRAAAAKGALQQGDSAAARDHLGHFLEVYEQEIERSRFGYEHHSAALSELRPLAQTVVDDQS